MLIAIRHGTTDYNEARIFSGHGDQPRLTNEALNQAFDIGKILKNYNLDLAFISPLTRAKQTFNEINKSLNIPSYTLEGLMERDFYKYEGAPLTSLDKTVYWDMDKSFVYDIEDIDDFVFRIEKSLNYIKVNFPNKKVLIVAHSGVCRAIKYIMEGKINRKWYLSDMNNLQVSVFENW